MTIENHQSLLASIISSNPNVNAAAQQVNGLTEMYKRGEINQEEYSSLIEDVQRQINIQANMTDLDSMEKLNTAINGLITLSKFV